METFFFARVGLKVWDRTLHMKDVEAQYAGLHFHNSFVNVGREPPPFVPAVPPKPAAEWGPPAFGRVLQAGEGWGERLHGPGTGPVEGPGDLPKAWSGLSDSRVPRLIFATDKDYTIADDPERGRWLRSCMAANPGWEVRLFSDEDSLAFVASEFPEYLGAYQALGHNVQRADYFRYLALLRYGGVYVDTDVECKEPFSAIVGAEDTLVVGWENEFPTVSYATLRTYARQKQVLQWALIGAPGHPALRDVSDHIARFATHVFTPNKDRNILEVTGPGAWTDCVLRRVPPRATALQFADWPVKLLPRVSMGNFPFGLDGLPAGAPGEIIVHQFKGSWKVKEDRHLEPRWSSRNPGPWILRPFVAWAMSRFPSYREIPDGPPAWRAFVRHYVMRVNPFLLGKNNRPPAVSPLDPAPVARHPLEEELWVNLKDDWAGDFSVGVFVHLIGVDALTRGDGRDPSMDLVRWGAAFPPLQPVRRPLPHDALLGFLTASPAAEACRGRGSADASCAAAAGGVDSAAFEGGAGRMPAATLVDTAVADVGVGAVTAAKRGVRVVAYRGDPAFSRVLERSRFEGVQLGFLPEGSLEVRGATLLGGDALPACVVRGDEWKLTAEEAASHGVRRASLADTRGRPLELEEGLQFEHPGLSRRLPTPPGVWVEPDSARCEDYLGVAGRVVALDDEARDGGLATGRFWGMSVANAGWEGWALLGASRTWSQHPPRALLLEWAPWEMVAHGWGNDPAEFLEWLVDSRGMGGRVYAAGEWCDRQLHKTLSVKSPNPTHPAWCRVGSRRVLQDLSRQAQLRTDRATLVMVHESVFMGQGHSEALVWAAHLDARSALLGRGTGWFSGGSQDADAGGVLRPDLTAA